MSQLSLTQFFSKLGAPMVNTRWSWGSVRQADHSVFMRVWAHQTARENGELWSLVFDDDFETTSPGSDERESHLEMIEGGSKGFAILGKSKDPSAKVQRTAEFDDSSIFEIDKIERRGTQVFARLARRISV